ncbi:ubiquitin carboxyl-terminal hydrolase 1 [Fundulus heteroclitus]|uniref:ubiquitin carboxyl-terminal hydrolase 1 n=1 Tax=Fundulus heteroclitus TaxID=8078 RepID=UPI00165BA87D|nr:ubiquitin carboxyl-terminal hydrolase 1 [Fundulus heteroclitus]XP_012733455.2 ubiquitin carboxyl-terminal hydrolase 1 [Fundulus heteroclitus]
MSGLLAENAGAGQGSPVKRNKLSLKFFHKKDTKRALDFNEPPAEDARAAEPEESEASCEQVVYGPTPCLASPDPVIPCEKKDNLVPFVGLNNLGNTCYLNSILQVLYYCPGFRQAVKKLNDLSKGRERPKEDTDKNQEPPECAPEALPAHMELLGSFSSLIASVEQLQSSYLLDPDGFSEGELATAPRKILHTIRQLNPMYEGYLQHDAQEVLQCILGYIQEACVTIRKEQELERKDDGSSDPSVSGKEAKASTDEDGQVSGKRKSDTEVGNAKKKPKSAKSKKSECAEENVCKSKPFTRSKRKSSCAIAVESAQSKDGEEEEEEEEKLNREEEVKDEKASAKETGGKRKIKATLGWLRSSGKQPSIFSKFCSVGKISSTAPKPESKAEQENEPPEEPRESSAQQPAPPRSAEGETDKHGDVLGLMEKLFQGRLVLRTRCLECESFTERREDFQDISVPVLDEQPSSPEELSEVSPDPKPEMKTLMWAISQFASVERIVGEDKYFCETCHHYAEAERSLLFDKTPEVITIHLKRFSTSSLEADPYAGLSKVNTPLQTPLTLSLADWCTEAGAATGQRYELFAVVMHSGVTISSGHYTTYVRMADLKDAEAWLQDTKDRGVQREEESKEAAREGETPASDGGDKASAGLSTRGQRRAGLAAPKPGSKKLSEGGVGLLGGQRSSSSCQLGGASKAGGGGAAEGSKRRKVLGSSGQNPDAPRKEAEEAATAAALPCGGAEATERRALRSLLPYEGKWLLFDDSEVRLFEEEDFLRACSPDTCSSSTPYLLFYKRMPEPGL